MLATREWDAIGLISSIHFSPAANSVLFLAATIELVYTFILYLLVTDSNGVMDVLFNCLALEFLLELDNVAALLLPKEIAHARDVLGRLTETLTYEDVVVYHATPSDEWGDFGWHRTSAWTRRLQVTLRASLHYLIIALHVTFLCLLLFCRQLIYIGNWAPPPPPGAPPNLPPPSWPVVPAWPPPLPPDLPHAENSSGEASFG
jgi:hypothetical protein